MKKKFTHFCKVLPSKLQACADSISFCPPSSSVPDGSRSLCHWVHDTGMVQFLYSTNFHWGNWKLKILFLIVTQMLILLALLKTFELNSISLYFFSQTQSVDLFCFSILMYSSVQNLVF